MKKNTSLSPPNEQAAYLQHTWRNVWVELRLKGDPAQAYEDLSLLYTVPSRFYHTLQGHVCDMLKHVDPFLWREHVSHEEQQIFRYAVFWHDAVQVNYSSDTGTPPTDNEERSAQLACEVLQAHGARGDLCGTVTRLILATKHHTPGETFLEQLIADEDMFILASSQPTYQRYLAGIAQEYAMYPRETFVRGRLAFVNSLLDKPSVFHTEHYFSQYEERARANLRLERELLQQSV